jgi:AraC family transcriptional regulator of adaptative response / DNA-3-methyladenine glycosylase II
LSSCDDVLYTAFKNRDSRYDGCFFAAIHSTKIYCRPVCSSPLAKKENCSFFKTAAQAEHNGYRPCLRCRPELAPPAPAMVTGDILAQRAQRFLDEYGCVGKGLTGLAAHVGLTEEALSRAFQSAFQVSPECCMESTALLLAKSLFTDSPLSSSEIASALGFKNSKTLERQFQENYRLSPRTLRKALSAEEEKNHDITVYLGYRPPYPFKQFLDFLSVRAIDGVEWIDGENYWRTVRLKKADHSDAVGWLKISNDTKKNALRITISKRLLSVLPQIQARVRHFFDLYCEPATIFEALASMNDIASELCHLGTRLPGAFDPFEMVVRAVLGQQITVKAACTLAGRFVRAFGTPVNCGIPSLTHTFPTPAEILALGEDIENHLGPLGIIARRAQTIRALALAFHEEHIAFTPWADAEEEISKLLAIPGIGPWTAHYIAMRTMAWTDAFLETDAGIKKALGRLSGKEMLQLAESWRPWRSYATINLWNSLQG